ncbi:hypothetical protein IWX49DRAFT_13504 [Phyllosticta citricarpa]|uniref:Secreted protein n=1 Tax=Phyllosticta citricarpa TaxID=55181 RepID=A0ABR1MQZ0_9PEZI
MLGSSALIYQRIWLSCLPLLCESLRYQRENVHYRTIGAGFWQTGKKKNVGLLGWKRNMHRRRNHLTRRRCVADGE